MQARENLCAIGQWLHVSGPKVQAAAAIALAGSDADRQAAVPNFNGSTVDAAYRADGSDVSSWTAAQTTLNQAHGATMTTLAMPPSGVDPSLANGSWYQVPDYNAGVRTFLTNRQDTTFHSKFTDPVTKADQPSLNAAIAMAKASTDPAMTGLGGVAGLIGNPTWGDYSTDAADIADFLTAGGFPTTAPAPGTVEFRTLVEQLKYRWAGCNSANPWDPHQVLGAAVTAAAGEWQAELAAQKPQRDDIVARSITAAADLQKASDAMAQAWIGQRLLELSRYIASIPAVSQPVCHPTLHSRCPDISHLPDDGRKHCADEMQHWCNLDRQVSQDLSAVSTNINTQLGIANTAAADAKTQADQVTSDQAAAGAIAKTNGTPYGRGLAYAQQSAQVTKASASAAQAATLAITTAQQAESASQADVGALWSLADTRAHALNAQFAKAAAQEAADQADKAAKAAADQATQAGLNAKAADADLKTAQDAHADAVNQAKTANDKRLIADKAAADAAAQRKTAQDQHDAAARAEGIAQKQAAAASTAHGNADTAAGTANAKAQAAAEAEKRRVRIAPRLLTLRIAPILRLHTLPRRMPSPRLKQATTTLPRPRTPRTRLMRPLRRLLSSRFGG